VMRECSPPIIDMAPSSENRRVRMKRGGCSAIIYRRSTHGGEWAERICSDGVLYCSKCALVALRYPT